MKSPLLSFHPVKKQSFPLLKVTIALVFLFLLGSAGGSVLYGQERLVVTRDGENPNLPGDHGQGGNQDADSIVTPGTSDTPLLPGDHGQGGNQDADSETPAQTTQTISLYAGWNWVSFFLECDAGFIAGLKEDIAQNNDESLIKDISQNSMLQNGVWYDGNLTFTNKSMYMILVKNDTPLTLHGTLAKPESNTITLFPGWNWIGFPETRSMTLEEALSGIQPNEGDVIKDVGKTSTYSGNEWQGSLTQLKPGTGYMYLNTGATFTLTFPSSK